MGYGPRDIKNRNQNLEDDAFCVADASSVWNTLWYHTPRAHTFQFFPQSSKCQHLEEEEVVISLTCWLVERKVAFETTSGVRRRIF